MHGKLAPWLLALSMAAAPLACAGTDSVDGDGAADGTDALTAGSTTPVFAAPTDDYATSVVVKNGMTLTMHATLAWHTGTSGLELVLKGSTSRDITFVQGFIPDDAFGTATQLGPRSFELVFDSASDIDTVLSGSPFYLELNTHTTTRDEVWSAQLVVAPRLVPPAGSSTTRLALGPAVTPTLVSDNPEGIHYRGTVTTTVKPQWLTVTAGSPPSLVKDAPHAWHFDWDFSHFESAAVSGTVQAKAKFGASTSTRSGTIEIRLAKVGLAAGQSADDIYGFPACDPAVLDCLRTLPADTIDFGACGAYLPVRVCIDENGFPVP
ncbi:MAG TPA: hypothetical protein VHB21_13395 [Minicystis sp.]|nr:hypothetical protein [Minicystis sp.]